MIMNVFEAGRKESKIKMALTLQIYCTYSVDCCFQEWYRLDVYLST